MKILKSVSLFFFYPLGVLLLGIWIGVQTEHFFYPGAGGKDDWIAEKVTDEIVSNITNAANTANTANTANAANAAGAETNDVTGGKEPDVGVDTETDVKITQVASRGETLSADTEYVLQEMDILHGTEVETSWELPKQYIGMNRERFMAAVQTYSDYPPLSEMERGFVNAEVISFARARVVVRKSYQYIQPGEGFYLAVKDNEVVVYLEDKETVYMNTGILLDTLPRDVQKQIIQTLFFEDEGSLYGFLESYSS